MKYLFVDGKFSGGGGGRGGNWRWTPKSGPQTSNSILKSSFDFHFNLFRYDLEILTQQTIAIELLHEIGHTVVYKLIIYA